MRLLDRYLLRELMIPLGYCLMGFFIFWIAFDLFSELSDYQDKRLDLGTVARLYWHKTPELLVVVIPIALLLALLYALTNHSRHQELTAIRAAGFGLARLSAPYFGVGLIMSLTLYAVNELWVPSSAETVDQILKNPSETGREAGRWHENLNFRNARDGRYWHISAYNLDSAEMKNPQVSWSAPDGSQRTVLAKWAVRTNNQWVFYEASEIIYPASGRFEDRIIKTHPALAAPEFTETPAQIKSEIKISPLRSKTAKAAKEAQLALREILNYLRLHPDLPANDQALLHTQFQARLAWPWTCLVVVLIALPFGAASSRRNVFVGVASSIFICFGFFILLRLGLALGTSGRLPPWLAAWLPHVVFGALGIWLTRRVR